MLEELAKLLFDARGWNGLSSWDELDDDHIDRQICRDDARAVALRVLEEMKRRLADADLSVVSSADIIDQLAAELGGGE